jgi:protoporphyrin/coproporphyrin ferrochelatase
MAADVRLTRPVVSLSAMDEPRAYDALLLVSFGGPEGRDDVMPFLENITRGRGVPRERLLEVAAHYEHFGGVSPINIQNRALLAALRAELDTHGPALPCYWGNRNWRPFLGDTVADMARDGVRRALAFVTSAFGSYSSCRQYLEDIARARAAVGADAPVVDKLRLFWNHPGFIEPMVERVETALAALPAASRASAHLAFTAHSMPRAMAAGSAYEAQLEAGCALVAERLATRHSWRLVYQSRSGPPSVPWLEPDIGAYLTTVRAAGVTDVVVAPIGFVSDHLEVRWDLDVEAAGRARDLGLRFVRAGTVGAHPRFVAMIRELILERTVGASRRALGAHGPAPDDCPVDCCPAVARPATHGA